ncbi:hypothetical protein Fot_19591 [Forsythia ovata]|uniref:Uncharacterized protein n=1 Tax=Forsythia ovata TaxID=205694 RepID=A0ABD1VLH1_9LAMI
MNANASASSDGFNVGAEHVCGARYDWQSSCAILASKVVSQPNPIIYISHYPNATSISSFKEKKINRKNYSNSIFLVHLYCVFVCAMESTRSSDVDLLKSKRALSSSAPSDQKAQIKYADPNPFSVKTPWKPANQPRRLRNRKCCAVNKRNSAGGQ